MTEIVKAKRLGWDEGPTGNVTRTDILDPYDYTDDDLEGVHVTKFVANDGIGPYTLHLVDGQVADPKTIVLLRTDADSTVSPATLLSSGGDHVTDVADPVIEDLEVTDAPWDGAASRFTDEQYKAAAAACDADSGDTPKAQCFLPHHEPGGAVNRNGVHAAAGRVDQVKGKSADSIAAAKSHLRSHYTKDLDEDPPDSLEAAEDTEDMGGKPNPNTPADKRLKQNKNKPASGGGTTTFADDTNDIPPQWRGVLVVEGSPTGDGREFAPDALDWADMPLPLRWQKVDSHGGMATNETVRVGNITRVWRDGSNIMGEGHFDLGGPEDDDAHEAYRRMGAQTLNGVSIDADDITDADIEYVFPEPDGDTDDEDDIFFLLFAMPDKIIFHAARIRAATLCDIPAFVEANLHLIGDGEAAVTASVTAYDPVSAHHTDTSRKSWNAAENEKRLTKRMSHLTAENAYAWVDRAEIAGGEVNKTACRFIHHEVDEEGRPGAANMTACASLIASLEKTRTVPKSDLRGIYTHLAQHLRDGGLEPPPFTAPQDALLAHAWHDEWRPPKSWFSDPHLGQYTPIVVTNDGRVYGHAAQWGQCHLGYMTECVMPPHEDAHPYFMTGEVVCDDGTRAAVGQITAGIEHAPLQYRASAAKEHYENTDAVVADVVVGNDQHGIWVAGAIRQSAQSARVNALRASGQVSPDWRRIGGSLRMVGLLTVNVSGYQVPRARSLVSGGAPQTLILAGMSAVQHHGPSEEELNQRALRQMQKALMERVHGGKR